jgi:hypothetical protein
VNCPPIAKPSIPVVNSPDYLQIFQQFDPAFEGEIDDGFLGADFAAELQTTSRVWIETGYRQGILAYLNFFLLKDFIVLHDKASAPRFKSFKSMADSFYRTDLFLRDVTDSGKNPPGGISSPKVQRQLQGIMARHSRLSIPIWMMAYFGFQLTEAGENEVPALNAEDRQLHLSYFSKTYRIMGIPFSADRDAMVKFARSIEAVHAGESQDLAKHARHVLILGEMVGVSSGSETITAKLPEATRAVFAPRHARVRPGFCARSLFPLAGGMLVKKAIGAPGRKTRPFSSLDIVE